MVNLRRLKREGLIRSDVPDDSFTEDELRELHAEVTELREQGAIE